LAGVPIDSLASAHNVLLALAEQAATDVGDEELLEGLMFRLTETLVNRPGFSRHLFASG
jgi:hypothetical protein